MRIYLAGVVLGWGIPGEDFMNKRERGRLFTFFELTPVSPIKTKPHFDYHLEQECSSISLQNQECQ